MRTATQTKTFLDPEQLLREIPLETGMTVADFGCGNGYYAVAAGSIVGKKGQVHAVDILDEALSQTATLARLTRLNNVATHHCNLEDVGTCPLADTSCDAVILSSLLHLVQNAEPVLREAYRVLKTGGKIIVVEWKAGGAIGPGPEHRVPEAEARRLLEKYGFHPQSELPAGSFHYALLYSK